MSLQIRRDTEANWTSENPTLASGEMGYETDTGKLKVGDGSAWNSTSYFASGGGSGTVTSVALSLPSFITVSGSPVTTSGTLTGTLATQNANLIFAGPATGSPAAPTFRALDAADLPAHTHAWSDITSGVPTTLAGYGITDDVIVEGDSRLSDARTPTAHSHDWGDITTGVPAPVTALSGTNTGDQNLFGTIAVSGQSDVVADSTSDTLTLAAGSGITITTNAGTDPVTIAASAGSTVNTENATVNMGTVGGKVSYFKTVAVAAAWATTGMTITASFYGTSAEAAMVQGMAVSVGTITNGVGFDLFVYSPFGSVGTYSVHCIGV